jgi:hypothetical protein
MERRRRKKCAAMTCVIGCLMDHERRERQVQGIARIEKKECIRRRRDSPSSLIHLPAFTFITSLLFISRFGEWRRQNE